MITDELRKQVVAALLQFGVRNPKADFEHPAELSHGDYSTNVALVYAKELQMKPKELAEKIVTRFNLGAGKRLNLIDRVKIAGPGFINFHLSKEFFVESVENILKEKENFGKNSKLKNKKVMVEYTDPNPFKEFHIGHLMSNAIGESIAMLLEAQGAEVKRACWQGDVGLHVAKAVFGAQKQIQDSRFKIQELTVKELGKAYAFGAEKYESDENAKKEINELNKKIFDRSDKEVNKLYDAGRKISLEHFEELYKILGTKFDYYFFEGKEGMTGVPIVEENIGKVFEKSDLPAPRPNIFFVYAVLCDDSSIYIGQTDDIQRRWREHESGTGAQHLEKHKPLKLIHYEEYASREEAVHREHDLKTGFGRKWLKREWEAGRTRQAGGAIIFRGEKYLPASGEARQAGGLHTRVFITSQGLPTYETKELGLNKAKFEKEPDLNQSIIVTANEQSDYFKVVLAAMKEIFPDIAAKTKHIAHGLLRFASGKMSSRKGNVITGEGIILKVKEMVEEKIKDREFSEDEREKVAEIVAVGAIKYSILRQAIGGDIIFDFDKSISFEGDSGPYLQYSYVRAKSVLQKAEEIEVQPQVEPQETTILERLLYRFPEVVERAGREYEPHYIVTYLTELAGVFNSWYAKEKIVDVEDKTSPYKVAITESFATIMQNGLSLLGIRVPEKM